MQVCWMQVCRLLWASTCGFPICASCLVSREVASCLYHGCLSIQGA